MRFPSLHGTREIRLFQILVSRCWRFLEQKRITLAVIINNYYNLPSDNKEDIDAPPMLEFSYIVRKLNYIFALYILSRCFYSLANNPWLGNQHYKNEKLGTTSSQENEGGRWANREKKKLNKFKYEFCIYSLTLSLREINPLTLMEFGVSNLRQGILKKKNISFREP